VGAKHPEDDHHIDCRPLPAGEIEVKDMDRTMRACVRLTGKRPRDAYIESLTSISKNFKSSEEQSAVVVQFPTFSGIRRS